MSDPLGKTDIDAALKDLPGWSHTHDKLAKSFQFTDFPEAMSFLARVAFAAEKHGHHPEIFNVYHKVTLALTTHDAGDKVTQKDLDLAHAVEHFNWLPKK